MNKNVHLLRLLGVSADLGAQQCERCGMSRFSDRGTRARWTDDVVEYFSSPWRCQGFAINGITIPFSELQLKRRAG